MKASFSKHILKPSNTQIASFAFALLLHALWQPLPAMADTTSEGWSWSVNCPGSGASFSSTFSSSTSGGFSGKGSCSRTTNRFTNFTFTSSSGGTLLSSSIYGLDTGDALILPPTLNTETEPIFAVPTECPATNQTLNWIFVQWGSSWNTALGSGNTVLGSASYSTSGGLSITHEYSVTGSTVSSSTIAIPGSCTASTGVYAATGTSLDEQGNIYFTLDAGGVFKTSGGHAAYFFPQYAVTPSSDLGSLTFQGQLFDSVSSSDAYQVQVTSDSTGLVYTVKPYSDVSTNTTSTTFVDTITLASPNTPQNGMLTGTVSRTGTGAGTGDMACITQITHTLNKKVICSGTSPANNNSPYTITFVAEGVGTLGQATPMSNMSVENDMTQPTRATVTGGKLVVADQGNNRVLIWNSIPTSSSTPPNVVVGQNSFDSTSSGTTASALNSPYDAYSDGTNLYVADTNNNRVLIWHGVPSVDGAPADVVVGQASMTTANIGFNGSGLSAPEGVYSDGSKLYVADRSNCRVLIWNTIPTSNGATADVVVGQPDMTTLNCTTTASGLNYPASVFKSGTKLLVSDNSNYRVMIWNNVPTSSGVAANVVVGQPNMTTGTSGTQSAATVAGGPSYASSDGTKLYVTDQNNHRVLIWNAIPTANGASANVVIGQTSMTTGTSGSTSASTLYYPFSAFSDGTKLYIADTSDNRVLLWNAIPTTNGSTASLVLGEADMSSTTYSVSASSLSGPKGVYGDGSRIAVADTTHNRVLLWNSIPTSSDAAANVVVGQASMSGTTPATTATGLNGPQGVWDNGTDLYVADTGNNRVLIWTALPTTNGASATYVLGQTTMTAGTAGTVSATSLNTPTKVFVSGTKVFVADSGNNRVLIWNALPTADGVAADVVLGQTSMTTATSPGGYPTASTLNNPKGVFTDGTKLYVADTNSCRILIWNSIPTASTTPADVVVGQANMTSAACGYSSTVMYLPTDVSSDGTHLFVSDQNNNRVMIWTPVPTVDGTAATYVFGQPNFTTVSPALGANALNVPAGLFFDGGRLWVTDSSNNRVVLFPVP